MARNNGKAARAARKWKRKAFKALRRAGAPRAVAKAGANNVGKAAYKVTKRRKGFRRKSFRRFRKYRR